VILDNVDVNGDGKINFEDRTDIGDPIPTATMGFNVQFNYKALDFLCILCFRERYGS
jgi:hypothetical protein